MIVTVEDDNLMPVPGEGELPSPDEADFAEEPTNIYISDNPFRDPETTPQQPSPKPSPRPSPQELTDLQAEMEAMGDEIDEIDDMVGKLLNVDVKEEDTGGKQMMSNDDSF